MKEYKYDKVLARDWDFDVYIEVSKKIKKLFPEAKMITNLRDVDDSLIRVFSVENGTIRLDCDQDIGAVYVRSDEIDLTELAEGYPKGE